MEYVHVRKSIQQYAIKCFTKSYSSTSLIRKAIVKDLSLVYQINNLVPSPRHKFNRACVVCSVQRDSLINPKLDKSKQCKGLISFKVDIIQFSWSALVSGFIEINGRLILPWSFMFSLSISCEKLLVRNF